MSVLIVGLSGVTNGGKTTLCNRLLKILPSCTNMLKQDDYFLPEDSSLHIPCSSEIVHNNWEVLTSLDMDKMVKDINKVIQNSLKIIPNKKLATQLCSICNGDMNLLSMDVDSMELLTSLRKCNNHRKILLIDGFIIFDDSRLRDLCELKFFVTLPKEECFARRQTREYDPPDPPGYFDVCVWPMYEQHLERVKKLKDVQFFDGTIHMDDILLQVFKEIMKASILQ